MALFIDTFVNRIDKKGRVSVPATFRAALAGQAFHGIVALPAYKYSALQCAGIDWLQNLSNQMGRVDLFSDAYDDLSAALFPDTKQLAFDGEGRVVLHETLIAHAKLADEAAFIGRGEIFEIWEPKALAAHKQEARRRALEKGRTLKSDGQAK
jgi:MraZ protein